MAHIMICDDDTEMSERLHRAIAVAGHTAIACRHTMDVLRAGMEGKFDLLALALDAPGFGSSNAALALHQLAPGIPLIGFHHTPAAIIGTPQYAFIRNVIARPVPTQEFLDAIASALTAPQPTASQSTVSQPAASHSHLATP
jgi:DNA-binding NtrC family response regulator